MVMERLDLGFFDEILVKTQSPSVYQRYLLAQEARNEIIYVQDDDALVNYQVLFGHYNGRITNAMTIPFQKFYEPLECTLVGWGCFFPKDLIHNFEKYVRKYGHDAHLLREADRIFTYLNRPFNTILQPHEDLHQGPERMSLQPEHFPSAYEALNKCRLL